MNALLSIIGDGYKITPSDSAQTQKSAVLANALQITAITSPEEMESARGALSRIKSFLSSLEESRVMAKEPFLTGGRFVDDTVKNFGAEVSTARTKLETQIKSYAAQQEKIRQDAERERMRLEREAREAQEELDRAELEKSREEARRLDEIRKKGLFAAQDSTSPAGNVVEVFEQKKEVAAQAQTALQHVHSTLSASALVLSKKLDFEITDVHALYGYDRALVELAPKRREILARISLLKTTRGGCEIPGVKIIEDFKV